MTSDEERREAAWLPEGVNPMPNVPEVRVLDEGGREVMRGYYCHHVNRQVAPLGADRLQPEDVDHCVVYDEFADWNMPKPVKVAKITPPHRIEVVGGIDCDALLALAYEIDRKSNDGTINPDPMRPLATSLDLFGYARRIREALGVTDED